MPIPGARNRPTNVKAVSRPRPGLLITVPHENGTEVVIFYELQQAREFTRACAWELSKIVPAYREKYHSIEIRTRPAVRGR